MKNTQKLIALALALLMLAGLGVSALADEPAVTVTAVWVDGSTVYSMGEPTPFGDGYYLSLSGRGETIYTIASPLTAYGTAGN